jgi:hypothetical protein
MSSNWQPISTAPKDGTSILIFEAHAGTAGIMRVSHWRDDTIPRGWTGAENAPSHWLPLPLPPNASGQSVAYDGRERRADVHTTKILTMAEARRIRRNSPLPALSNTKKK